MAYSVESRLPFLDYRIVELALSLPDVYKITGGMTKRVLRESMKGILPKPVRIRFAKHGFVFPEEHWLRDDNGLFRDRLQHAVKVSCGILCPPVHAVLDDMLAGRQPFSSIVWRMINFGQCMERFSLKGPH
jgi:asparagine synthase (glutamine-hydrolysing)